MCTNHSLERAAERTRYSGKSAEHFIRNGITRGKTAEAFTHREHEWLTGLAREGCIPKVYNGYCLIVSGDGVCVTLYELPGWFGKKRRYDGDKPIRNAKRITAFRDCANDMILAC